MNHGAPAWVFAAAIRHLPTTPTLPASFVGSEVFGPYVSRTVGGGVPRSSGSIQARFLQTRRDQ